jgi:hypothetical protein
MSFFFFGGGGGCCGSQSHLLFKLCYVFRLSRPLADYHLMLAESPAFPLLVIITHFNYFYRNIMCHSLEDLIVLIGIPADG